MSKKTKKLILWMDLEMTGLDPKKDQIIEIASLVTDWELNIIAHGPELVIHQEKERFDLMDSWNQTHHTQSGLWEKVLNSELTIADAQTQTLAFIKKHFNSFEATLAGNSIWQDRRFLYEHMPDIESYLHYRMLDVSSVKMLCQHWYKHESKQKKAAHRALDDIEESVEELKSYRKSYFIPKA